MKNSCDTLPPQFTYEDTSIQIDGVCCAIIGVENGSIVYDYGLLVKHFTEHNILGVGSQEELEDAAIDYIEFNIIRAIPYYQTHKYPPIIKYTEYDTEDDI